LWKAEDQGSPARTPSLGVSEELSDLVDIETVPSPLRRLLKEAESDSTKAEDDKSDEDDEGNDGEDEDETEENNGFMQNRAVQFGGAALCGGVVCGGLVHCLKKGAPVETPQGIAVAIGSAGLNAAAVKALTDDSKVLSTVQAGSKIIYTSYDTFANFQNKHSAATVSASEGNKNDYAVYALQGFGDADLPKFNAITVATKNSIKDRVILTDAQFKAQLKEMDVRGKVEIDGLIFLMDPINMILTKVPAPPADASG